MANSKQWGSRADRLRVMADDVALDMTLTQLADKYEVSVTTAHTDVKKIKADWLKSRNDTIEQARAVQAARLVRFIREMWDAWFESKGWQIKLREEQRPGEPQQVEGVVISGDPLTELLTPGDPVTVKSFKSSYYSPGNVRYAEQILGAYDQLAKLQGLYAAKEIHLNIKQLVEQEAEKLGLDPAKVMSEMEEIASNAWRANGAS